MDIAKGAPVERARKELSAESRAARAAWLWHRSQPLCATAGERYFRQARGISIPMPAILRYLPAWRDYPHAVISACGVPPQAIEAGLPEAKSPKAVHLTPLLPDGLGRLEKRMIGLVSGRPLILSPARPWQVLYICEGIEDGLSLMEATGAPVWAAGAACFLPKLAEAIPKDVRLVTVVADTDPQGRAMARKLVARLNRGAIAAEIAWLDAPANRGPA